MDAVTDLTAALKSAAEFDETHAVAHEQKIQADGRKYEHDYVPDFADGANHREPDLYTRYGCVLHHAIEALERGEQLIQGRKE